MSPGEIETEVTIKVRHKKDDVETVEELKKMTVIGSQVCERHGTIAIVGTLKPNDGVIVSCGLAALASLAKNLMREANEIEDTEHAVN